MDADNLVLAAGTNLGDGNLATGVVGGSPGQVVMKIAGLACLIALGFFLVPHWVRSRRRAQAAPTDDPEGTGAS